MNNRFYKPTLYLLLVIILVILLVILLAACGGDSENDSPTNTPESSANGQAATGADAPLDPGPYFTPRRAAPEDAETFAPDEEVGDFTRFSMTGNCLQDAGLTAQFSNSENQIINLQCRYAPDALEMLQNLVSSGALTADPVVMKIQGDESFLLGVSGNAYIYAWTHGRWFFLARSLSGRSALDAFMEAFPY